VINNHAFTLLIDLVTNHIYIDRKVLERFQFPRRKHGKYWLVQLTTGSKRKVVEMVKSCPVDMNEISTKKDLSILPLGSYDCPVGMDWLDQHHVVLYYHNKEFTSLNEDRNPRTVQGIPRAASV
jgi:hypothetical protein